MKAVETSLEKIIFHSRWLMAPFYLGLVVALGVLMVKFVIELIELVPEVVHLKETEVILGILTLIDLSLAGNLLLIVIFAGYENFVSKIDVARHKDRPEWMGTVDFSGLPRPAGAGVDIGAHEGGARPLTAPAGLRFVR